MLHSDENNAVEMVRSSNEPDSSRDNSKGKSSGSQLRKKSFVESDEFSKDGPASEVEFDQSKVERHIGGVEEAPEWLIDNHFILTGYRLGFSKVKDVLRSLFMIHNETTNIWSHLSGVLLFIMLMTYIIF